MTEYTEITEGSKAIMRGMDVDAKALDILNEIESKEYSHPAQKKAEIQCVIIDLLSKIDELEELRGKAAAFDFIDRYVYVHEICVLEVKCTGDGGHSCGQTWTEISSGSGSKREGAGSDLLEAVNNAIGGS